MKNRQGLTIAALIIAIVGLSIGFAAFSNTLTISSSATVNPANTMRVVFSKSQNTEVTGAAHSVLPDSNTYGDGATIDNTGTHTSALTDLHAKFTAPNQSVTYNTDLYVTNVGNYRAQLTGITFNNATGFEQGETATYKRCSVATTDSNSQPIPASQQATPSLVSTACNGISISVTIGSAQNVTPSTTGNLAALNYQIINVGSSLPVSITISYDEGSAYVDGPMEVTFGNIVISATSAVDETLVVTPLSPSTPSESQIVVGTLEPTEQQLSWVTPDYEDSSEFEFIESESLVLKYDDYSGLKYVVITTNLPDKEFWWACDSSTAIALSSMFQITVQPNAWYYSVDDGETYSLYEGPSPIDLNDFDPGEIKNTEYVLRVINSFSNNS